MEKFKVKLFERTYPRELEADINSFLVALFKNNGQVLDIDIGESKDGFFAIIKWNKENT